MLASHNHRWIAFVRRLSSEHDKREVIDADTHGHAFTKTTTLKSLESLLNSMQHVTFHAAIEAIFSYGGASEPTAGTLLTLPRINGKSMLNVKTARKC